MRAFVIAVLLFSSLPAAADPIDGEVVRAELEGVLRWAGVFSRSATANEKAGLRHVQAAGLPDAQRLARALERAITPQLYADKRPAPPSRDGRIVREAIKGLAQAELQHRAGRAGAHLTIDGAMQGNRGVVLSGAYTNEVHHTRDFNLRVSVHTSAKGRPFMVLSSHPFARRPVVVPLPTPRGRLK